MKIIFVILGGMFLFLGMLGIPLPVLPTTPFLLLSSYCFMRGSRKMDLWFKKTKLYKAYLLHYNPRTGMTKEKKIQILLIGTITIGLSFFLVNHFHVRIILAAVLFVKYYYFIFKVKTVTVEKMKNSEATS